jgi:Putative Tad-like Flp pilus-assembly
LFTDRRAAVSLLVGLALPALAGFAALGIEANHIQYEKLLLDQTVETSALAGANKISSYYTSGTNSSAAIVSSAQTIASAKMPATTTVQGHAAPLYGTVVPAANVVLGNWDTTASTFTSLAASGGTTPNAVQVTGLETSANGNPVAMFFGNVLGYATKDITATAVASYGTGQSFNTIVINDLSQSFLPDIASQRAADTAILNCIANAAGSASKFGITTINGSAWTYAFDPGQRLREPDQDQRADVVYLTVHHQHEPDIVHRGGIVLIMQRGAVAGSLRRVGGVADRWHWHLTGGPVDGTDQLYVRRVLPVPSSVRDAVCRPGRC